MKKKSRSAKIKARAKKGSQIARQQGQISKSVFDKYIKQAEGLKGASFTEAQKSELREAIRQGYKEGANIESIVQKQADKAAGQFGRASDRGRENLVSTKSGGQAYTVRFAEVADKAYEIIQRLNGLDMTPALSRVVDIANEIINYSTSDQYDYTYILEEERSGANELLNAIEDAYEELDEQEMEQLNGDEEMFAEDYTPRLVLDELYRLATEIDRNASMSYKGNRMAEKNRGRLKGHSK